jgi:uracil phosphoribosyltransferase
MEICHKEHKNVVLCPHPIAQHNLTIIRDKNSSAELYRNASKRLVQILFFIATNNLPLAETTVDTPLVKTNSFCIRPSAEIIFAPILRAGLVFSEVASELLPNARVHHIGLYRDEETLKPVAYYNNLPNSFKEPENTFVYILDPMLATGGSAVSSIKLFSSLNIPHENIRFVCLISAPEGINKVVEEFPDVKIITACIDEKLNESGYILPGLGDAGDRTFNTVY